MSGSSTRTRSLGERLRERIAEDRQLIERHRKQCEQVLAEELRKLTASSRRRAAAARRTIGSDLGEVVARQRAVLAWSWVLPLAAGIGLFALILLSNWGLTQWLSSSIRGRIAEREALGAEIAERQRTLEELETWGLQLVETRDSRYVGLPRGVTGQMVTTEDGQQYVQLSRR